MDEVPEWAVTTHEWTATVDAAHLRQVRADAAAFRGGRRHLVLEVLAYADDEAQALGRRGRARVSLHPDGSVTVADDGRGTDTRHDRSGPPTRKPVMATKDVRFFDVPDAPVLPDGLPRRGMSTVAALSSWLVHENRRGGAGWTQTYRAGVPETELRPLPGPTPPTTGPPPRTSPGSRGWRSPSRSSPAADLAVRGYEMLPCAEEAEVRAVADGRGAPGRPVAGRS